jgi:murein DD-endopeptidase MepM/ murein hydrolase activator NlpD
MANNKGKKSIFKKLYHKYRLAIYRDESYEEVLNIKLTRLNVFTILGVSLLIFLAIVISIIAYTPVREFIPGYPDENTRKDIINNALMLDSLENELAMRDEYFNDINSIIRGKNPPNHEEVGDTATSHNNVVFTRSSEDSLLRQMIEQEEQFNLGVVDDKKSIKGMSKLHFFSPIKGLVTNSFNAIQNHYGTDIVGAPNEVVKATLGGTVVMATWTLETGYVIEIQHDNNLISVYKHNAELLKRVGDHIRVGDPIAIMGNSGELTTGPHLHFELWYKGTPLNPEDYISF